MAMEKKPKREQKIRELKMRGAGHNGKG